MPITFVKEYCNYTKNFAVEPNSVAAIDVSYCHLLEINNRDNANRRTVFSLSHFTSVQLQYPNIGILKSNLEKILSSFKDCGGNIETAQIRIYGGEQFNSGKRESLKEGLKNILGANIKIEEPKGHHMQGRKDSLTYLFSSDRISYRRSDMNIEDGYKDEFSKDMLNSDGSVNKSAVDKWQKAIDDSYHPISRNLDSIVEVRQKAFSKYSREKLESFFDLSKKDQDDILSLLSVELVDITGFKIKNHKQESPSSIFQATSKTPINEDQKNVLNK